MVKKTFVFLLIILLVTTMSGLLSYAAPYTETFDYSSGDDLKNALRDKWNYAGLKEIGTADGTKIVNGAYYMQFTDALHLKWKNPLNTYEFKVSAKGGNGDGHGNPVGIFLRTTITDYFGMTPFEETKAGGTTGISGVFIKLHANNILVYVKTYDAASTYSSPSTQNKITYAGYEFIQFVIPGEKNAVNDMINFRVTDDGSLMSIYVQDILCAKVEMSEAQDITMHDTSIGTYYTKAILTNVLNNESKTVTNARIAKTDATIALAVRGAGMYVDNLYLDEQYGVVNPGTSDSSVLLILAATVSAGAIILKRKKLYNI